MTDFTIEYLADYPEYIQACAAWGFGRWGVQKPHGSLDRAIKHFEKSCQKDALPLGLVVINKETELPIGMGCLVEQDGDDWLGRTPWIASVFTHYRHEGQGIAKAVISRLEEEAQNLGFKSVYLYSGTAAYLYRKIDYTEIDSKITDKSAAGKITLFEKKLI